MTTDPFKCFLDLHPDYRYDARTEQYLALSSATSHGFRQSTRVLAGMSLDF
ncbi:putative transporter [Escherichia coli]|uniref:Putative transporter n=1 Tax=Escherichia coli TaxID=562 RepID=A0A377BVS6_ECOLX|nr:putative transporter [Escherichia coli]